MFFDGYIEPIPLLSKEGRREAPGWLRESRSLLDMPRSIRIFNKVRFATIYEVASHLS